MKKLMKKMGKNGAPLLVVGGLIALVVMVNIDWKVLGIICATFLAHTKIIKDD